MVFFFGTRTAQRELPPERKVCPVCLSVTDHAVVDRDTRFTLYFIPLFSIKREILYTCLRCDDTHTLPYAEYRAARSGRASGGTRPPREARKAERPPAVLEGQLVDGEIRTAPSAGAQFSFYNFVRWMWTTFALFALVAIALFIILIMIVAR